MAAQGKSWLGMLWRPLAALLLWVLGMVPLIAAPPLLPSFVETRVGDVTAFPVDGIPAAPLYPSDLHQLCGPPLEGVATGFSGKTASAQFGFKTIDASGSPDHNSLSASGLPRNFGKKYLGAPTRQLTGDPGYTPDIDRTMRQFNLVLAAGAALPVAVEAGFVAAGVGFTSGAGIEAGRQAVMGEQFDGMGVLEGGVTGVFGAPAATLGKVGSRMAGSSTRYAARQAARSAGGYLPNLSGLDDAFAAMPGMEARWGSQIERTWDEGRAMVAMARSASPSASAINPRLLQRLQKWREYADGGSMKMGEWVSTTSGASWGHASSTGYARWLKRVESVHGNSMAATGPHLVYAMMDNATGITLHIGETGRGMARIYEHIRNFHKLGITAVPRTLANVEGKAAAKEIEARYLRTFETLFDKTPDYNFNMH